MNVLLVNYIDGQNHDITSDYGLLLTDRAFEVQFSPTDIDDIKKLEEEAESLIDKINEIKDERGKIETFNLFLKCLSNQLGKDFSSIEDLKEHLRVMADQAGYVDKESKVRDNDLSDLKQFNSGSELVEMGDLNG